MIGKVVRHIDWTSDDRVLFITRANYGVRMRNIRQSQQHVAKLLRHSVSFGGKVLLVVAQCPTLLREDFGLRIFSASAQ